MEINNTSQITAVTKSWDGSSNNVQTQETKIDTYNPVIEKLLELKNEPQAQVSEEKLKRVSEQINQFLDSMNVELKFSVHKELHQIVVKAVNVETGQVIREIPPEKVLDMVAGMLKLVGLLVDEKM